MSISDDALSCSHFLIRSATLAAFCILTLSAPALAQDQPVPGQAEPAPTRIEADEQAGVIRFFIEGQEAAYLDAEGLHLRESIEYGGTLTDTGTAYYDQRAARPQGGAGAN